jgi:hypothetical protein
MKPQPSTSTSMKEFIRGLPKAELHVHIEGTLEPELAFRLAVLRDEDDFYRPSRMPARKVRRLISVKRWMFSTSCASITACVVKKTSH